MITVLEANLDDLNPQVFGYVMDRLFEEGALDAFGMPVQMKKNRPGTLLTVLCKPEDAGKLSQLIFTETTTLGVRRRDEVRETLARRWEKVCTQWGDVRIKIASMNGTVTNYAPEYEDCRRIADGASSSPEGSAARGVALIRERSQVIGSRAHDSIECLKRKLNTVQSDVRCGGGGICAAIVRRVEHKPMDRKLLDQFADRVRDAGMVCDLGCGPGQIARYLHDRGITVCGVDSHNE